MSFGDRQKQFAYFRENLKNMVGCPQRKLIKSSGPRSLTYDRPATKKPSRRTAFIIVERLIHLYQEPHRIHRDSSNARLEVQMRSGRHTPCTRSAGHPSGVANNFTAFNEGVFLSHDA